MINNNNELIKFINKEKSYSIIRFGNVEMDTIIKDSITPEMFLNAGFYGVEKDYINWKNKFAISVYNCDCILDVVSCDSFQIISDLLYKLKVWKPVLPYVEDPKYYIDLLDEIETQEINVISYFKNDIESQLKNMNKIWNKNINKKFIIHKSQNTIKGNEVDSGWTETFEKLCDSLGNVKNKLFFVSCGCYGLPVCDYIKTNGGKAIYIGGIMQLLFGLRGKRWDDRNEVKKHFNKFWKYPIEKPKGFNRVEDGCYWN